jgi:hypothetical protein
MGSANLLERHGVKQLCQEAGLVLFDLDGNGPFGLEEFERRFASGTHWNWVARP